jgi:ketopantoate hydroxymethyltransferase
MKLVKIKISHDEAVFYRQGVFTGCDDLVIFPMEDFLSFHNNLKDCLNNAMNIVEDSRNHQSKHGAINDAQRIINWLKLVDQEIEKLNKTDVQKNLLSYK